MGAAFIDAIVDDPSDEGRWVAYADWLIEQNHPRGELINFALAVERGLDGEEVARRWRLLDRDDQKLLSPRLFAQREAWELEWKRGFIQGAQSQTQAGFGPESVEALFADPHVGLLEHLEIIGYNDVIAPVFEAPRRHLRSLAVMQLGPLASRLNDVLPSLEDLIIHNGGSRACSGLHVDGIEMLAHTNLRMLAADRYSCPAVCTAASSVPRLETLEWTVFPDGDDIAGEGSIVHRPPPGLRRLVLVDECTPSGRDAIEAAFRIVDTAVFPQLVSLEFVSLGVAALERLCTLAPRLTHLEHLRFGASIALVFDDGPIEPIVELEFLAEVKKRLVAAMPRTNIDFPPELPERTIPTIFAIVPGFTFIHAIVENPDDEGRWIVYADWLLQRNDPRGELINFELAVERGAIDSEELTRRAAAIVRDDERLLSPRLFAQWHLWDLEWWRGFIRGAESRPEEDWGSEAVAALFADPHAGLLASLDVIGPEDVTAPVFEEPRRHLRRLSVTELGRFAYELNDVMPNLEELALTGGTIAAHADVSIAGIMTLAHANLRRLDADQYTCPAATTASLIVPRLETLQWTVMPDYDELASEGSIVHRPPPGLRRLILLDGSMPSGNDAIDVAGAITDTALMRQLVSLELGDLGVAALEALCTLAPQLAHLVELRFGVPFTFIGQESEPPVHVEFLAEIEQRLVAAMPHTKIEFPRESRVEPAQI